MDDTTAAHLAAACSRSALHIDAYGQLREAFPDCKLLRLSFGLQTKVMLSITIDLEREGCTHASYVPIHPTAAAAAVLQNNPVVVVRQNKRSPLWDQEDLYQREGCSTLSVVSMPFYWPPRPGAQWEGVPLAVPQNPAFHPTFGALTAAGDTALTQATMQVLLDLAARTGRHVGPHISMLIASLEAAELLPSEAEAQEELGISKEEGGSDGEEGTEAVFGFGDAHSRATGTETADDLLASLGPAPAPTNPDIPCCPQQRPEPPPWLLEALPSLTRVAEDGEGSSAPTSDPQVTTGQSVASDVGCHDRVPHHSGDCVPQQQQEQRGYQQQQQQQPREQAEQVRQVAAQQQDDCEASDQRSWAAGNRGGLTPPAGPQQAAEAMAAGIPPGSLPAGRQPHSHRTSTTSEGGSSTTAGNSPATRALEAAARLPAAVAKGWRCDESGILACLPWYNLNFKPEGLERAFAAHYSHRHERGDLLALAVLALLLSTVAAAQVEAAWLAGASAMLLFAPYFTSARLYRHWRTKLVSSSLLLMSIFLASISPQSTEVPTGTCDGGDDSCPAVVSKQLTGFGICWFVLHHCGLLKLMAGPLLLRLPAHCALLVQGASLTIALYRLPAAYFAFMGTLDTVHVMLLGLLLTVSACASLSLCQLLERQDRRAWLERRVRRGAQMSLVAALSTS